MDLLILKKKKKSQQLQYPSQPHIKIDLLVVSR